MRFDDVDRFVGGMMSGLSMRHDLGSEVDDVGRLIGDRPIKDGDAEVSLYELMQDGMGVLPDASTGKQATKLVAATTHQGALRCRGRRSVDAHPSRCLCCLVGSARQHGRVGASAPSLVQADPGRRIHGAIGSRPRRAGPFSAVNTGGYDRDGAVGPLRTRALPTCGHAFQRSADHPDSGPTPRSATRVPGRLVFRPRPA